MRRKDNSVELEIHPYLSAFLIQVDDAYREAGGELVITSGSEHGARHSFKSLHYAGCAVDTRTWEFTGKDGQMVTETAQHRILLDAAAAFCRRHPMLEPGDIDVVLERDHIHTELQPKRRTP